MSVHSIDHLDDEVSDVAYKGYHIDPTGEVTEFYDHRDEGPAPSSVAASSYRQPLVKSRSTPMLSVPEPPPVRKVKHKDAGCCNSCVSLLTTIGRMPFATGFALFCSWLGTAFFIGFGWKALDDSLSLFLKYGPNDGNPASDPAPQYLLTGIGIEEGHVLVNENNLGNRVPQVFRSLQYSFVAIIPFMLIFTIIVACDNRHTSRSLISKKRSCKTSSSGICCTAGLIVCTYLLILFWVFFLAFTTLGVYYYRITMLRCYDLNDRGYREGVFQSICIDLVQLGLIMFQNTNDEGFGKLCGPGDTTMRTYGQLKEYCEDYYPVYQFMLLAFAGCLLNIIAMVNFIMILSINYNTLTLTLNRKRKVPQNGTVVASNVPSSYRPSPVPTASIPNSTFSGPPAYVRGTRSANYPVHDDYRARRSSKDIEMDYIIDDESSVMPRRRDLDSNVGVNYYYRNRR